MLKARGTARLPARYEVIEERGRGGMGVVYEALDQERGHNVAVKTLRRVSADALYKLKKEFRSLADLAHPNLVQLYDLVVVGDSPFFTMEVIDGEDFVTFCRGNAGSVEAADTIDDTGEFQRRAAGAGFDQARLESSLSQLAAALMALHDAGKLHRDIKPTNVLVTADGRLVLLDLGLVVESDVESLQGELVGTVYYMAPEQAAQAEELTPASDWYGVGALLYEALTGRPPHTGPLVEVLLKKRREPIVSPDTLVPAVPAHLAELCMNLLALDPAERATGTDIINALGGPSRGAATFTSSAIHQHTQTSVFTGRQAELRTLEAAMEQVRGGKMAIAHVKGTSGIGKSALIKEFLTRAAARNPDLLVLRGRCYEREFVPFKAIDGLIDGLAREWRRLPEHEALALLPRAASSLRRLFPVMGRVSAVAEAPILAESPNPLQARARAFDALREVLQRMADRGPLILFLDDLQWVDADTLTLLDSVLREPDPPRVLLIVSQRSETEGTEELEAAVAELGGAKFRVELGPLNEQEASLLVTSMLQRTDRDVIRRVVTEAAGSPFFLCEIVRYLQTVDDPREATVSLDNVVQQRIELLSPQARRLLEVATVAGEPLAPRAAMSAADVDPETYARELRTLRIGHMLRHPGGKSDDRIEPYHDRLRESISALLQPEHKRDYHRRLALALEGDASHARLARHWAGAGDHEKAAAYSRRAGDEAMGTFEFEQAASLYRNALRAPDMDDATKLELLSKLGMALQHAGRCAEAAEALLGAAEHSEGVAQLDYRCRAAENLLIAGLIPRGMEVISDVLAEIGERLPPSPKKTLPRFIWHYLMLRLRGFRWKPTDISEIPPRDLVQLDMYIGFGRVLGFVDTMRAGLFQLKGMRQALRIGERSRIIETLGHQVLFHLAQGGKPGRYGERLLERFHEIAGGDPGPVARAYGMLLTSFAEYFEGDYRAAITHLDEGNAIWRDESSERRTELNNGRIFVLQSMRFLGVFDELRERFDLVWRDAQHVGDQYLKTTLGRAINVRFLADDNVEAARRVLDQVSWSPEQEGYHLQHWYELRAQVDIALYERADLAECAGFVEGFAALEDSMLLRVQTVRAESTWYQGRLGLFTADARWKPAAALKTLRREGRAFTRVWAALLGAGVAQAAGDGGAAERYAEAGTIADEAGMVLCAAAARWRQGELLGGAEGEALVGGAERQMRKHGVAAPGRMVGVLAPVQRQAG